ncbi:alpha/beta hydrolase family protein [Lentzea sp. JNUCC 0626]|uniref:alpha/beta hydrolase family protein n=1 Tax=Lentzea sp. JNUCC 0626 TaxID=3367513 RepID=UPI003749E085
MRRTVALLVPVLLFGVLPALPASAAPGTPTTPGWSVSGDVIRWTTPSSMPLRDAGVEFWEGDRFLGHARESANLRTFTLEAKLTDPAALQVRSAGKRLDVFEPPVASLSAPQLPALQPDGGVDPGKPGPYETTTGAYALDSIKLPGYAAPIEMEGVVVAPKGAPGKRSLALFLHGRHFTCYSKSDPNQITLNWPCPSGLTAVPSHKGYLKAQELLASQGYLTVSISANGINAQDAGTPDAGAQGRSSLVRHHLAKWADWAAGRGAVPDAVKSGPAADMSKVLLYGHSRGGEGVNRAATDSLAPPPGDTGFSGPVRWNIRGTVLVGPTIFGHNPAPDVPSVTFLPGCDGDVSDLQGQIFVDQTRGLSRGEAFHSALYMVGANHNYFNSEWTPGQAEAPASDDFWPGEQPDPLCTPGTPTRLTAEQQQTMGATYVAAATKLFLGKDESVLPLLDGSGVRAPSADPARVLSHAVGADRKSFVVPDGATGVSGSARVCQQTSRDAAIGCTTARSPHFVGFRGAVSQPERLAVTLKWTSAGQAGVVTPGAPVSLAGSRDLALRLAVPPNAAASKFGVAVTDHNGRKHALGSVSVAGLPGSDRTSSLWAQEVRVPLPHGLGKVASLELVPESASGEAWLIDAYGWDKGLVPVVPTKLSRVDSVLTEVPEGDSGTQTRNVVITATGNGTRVFRLFYNEPGNKPATKLVTLKQGEHQAEVPLTWTGNTRWGSDVLNPVQVQAISNAVVGSATGGLLVRNDDPMPKLTVTPVADSVAEGGKLKWKLTLSEPADSAFMFYGTPAAPASGAELSTTDVDPTWFEQNSGEKPLPARPLSATGLGIYVFINPGATSYEFEVPTVTDTETEGEEQVRLKFEGFNPTGTDFEVTGKVTEAV